MKTRIAVLVLAVGFTAAPSLAFESAACMECCAEQSVGTHGPTSADCGSLVAGPCCEIAPAVPTAPAKPAIDSPISWAIAVPLACAIAACEVARAARVIPPLAVARSPLRLSVVRQL